MDWYHGTRTLLKLIETRVSRARDLHPHDRNSPDPLSVTKPLFFDLRFTLRRSHSKGMDIETMSHLFSLSLCCLSVNLNDTKTFINRPL